MAESILFALVARWEERGGDLYAPPLLTPHLGPTTSHTCYFWVDCTGVNFGAFQASSILMIKEVTIWTYILLLLFRNVP